ncbi:MAG: hypothetical protein WCF67_16550 [Chitinophagaceae bacterium]
MRLTLFLLLLPVCSIAQKKDFGKNDSASYYQQKIKDLYKAAHEQLANSDEYRQAMNALMDIKRKSDSYFALMLSGDAVAADYDKLNALIVPKGFSPLKGPVYRIGFGVSRKRNRRVTDFSFFSLGFNNKSTKPGERIQASFSSAFALDMGYDLTRSTAINIYPYAGLSIQTASLQYKKTGQNNPAYTDITNILLNEQETNASYAKIGYQAGIGFDFVLGKAGQRTGGTMAFIKAGTNRLFGKPVYKIGSTKYDPGISYGEWVITFGFKFFDRQ